MCVLSDTELFIYDAIIVLLIFTFGGGFKGVSDWVDRKPHLVKIYQMMRFPLSILLTALLVYITVK